MGQHLHLYASKTLTLAEVDTWCHARCYELFEMPSAEDQPIVDKVRDEMSRLKYHSDSKDHLEHWSNWCGPYIWGFLVWHPYVCGQYIIDVAIGAAKTSMETHAGLQAQYPGKDFTQDTPIDFLRSHIGYVVWGDNDGI